MKKLLFLIPVILLILNATPLALYKNSVNYSPNGMAYSLSPSYWKQLKIIQSSHSPYKDMVFGSSAGTMPSAVALSKGAHFYGFPVGFYFKKSGVLNQSLPGVPYTIEAFSSRWAIVDGSIIFVTLLIALFFNLRHGKSKLTENSESAINS
jgi:hypothetical protein